MTDAMSLLKSLNRPRLLVQAARHAMRDYNREKMLARLFKDTEKSGPTETALRLLSMEQMHEERRVERDATYSVARHIEVLVALMAEAQALAQRSRDRAAMHQVNASATLSFLRAI